MGELQPQSEIGNALNSLRDMVAIQAGTQKYQIDANLKSEELRLQLEREKMALSAGHANRVHRQEFWFKATGLAIGAGFLLQVFNQQHWACDTLPNSNCFHACRFQLR